MSVCAYCGTTTDKIEREHVIPKSAYPKSVRNEKDLITVRTCRKCNDGFSADDEHFRTVITLAAERGTLQNEQWNVISRSFKKNGGESKKARLRRIIRDQVVNGQNVSLIFPGEDEGVLRTVRKIARGLCVHHGMMPYVTEDRVFALQLLYSIPEQFDDELQHCNTAGSICTYRYGVLKDSEYGFHSGWILEFMGGVKFMAIVHNTTTDAQEFLNEFER